MRNYGNLKLQAVRVGRIGLRYISQKPKIIIHLAD